MNRPYQDADLEPIFEILEQIIQEDLEKAKKGQRWEWARALELALKKIPVLGKLASLREVIALLRGNDHLEQQVVFNMIGVDLLHEIYLRHAEDRNRDTEDHRHQNERLDDIWKFIQERNKPAMTPEIERDLLNRYLDKIIAANSRIDIQGIGSKPGAGHEALSFPIEELYTPLKMLNPKSNEQPESTMKAGEQLLSDLRDTKRTSPLTDLLSNTKRLLIIGQPGGGKTTFLRLIACVLAKDARHDGQTGYEPGRAKYLGMSLDDPAPIPILLKISTLSRIVADQTAIDPECGAEWRWVIRDLENSYGKETTAILEKHLKDHQVALLLDGLDEEPDESVRKKLVDTFRSVLQHWGKNLIAISSRPYGYQAVSGLEQVQTVRIAPFGEEEIIKFIDHWDKGLSRNNLTASDPSYRESLEKALTDKNVQELASNPVMLTCLCVVHWNERKLPEGKANLLAAVLRWLLEAKEEKRKKRGYDGGFVNESFKRLALAMTDHENGKQVDVELHWAAPQLLATYEEELGETNGDKARKSAVKLLEDETIDSGIIEQAEIGIRFWHLTFQEYLAARALLDKSEEEWWPIVRWRLADRQWNEVIDQLAGILASEKNRLGLRRFVNRIIQTAMENDLYKTAVAVGVVGRLLQLVAVYGIQWQPTEDWIHALEWAKVIFTDDGAKQVPIDLRLPVAEVVGRMGDLRIRPFDPEMLPIPPIEKVLLGKYPVTVQEYKIFIEEGGYVTRTYWQDGWEIKKERKWELPNWWGLQQGHPNSPIMGISWFEANAYCEWLSSRTGRHYRLPTEKEWKAAAVHPDGGDYPWGAEEPNKELLNYNMNVGYPTPVGLYPAGAGHSSHLDLAGNVWEWCKDWYDKQKKHRVVRGGCWFNIAGFVRASIRSWSVPDGRDDIAGFRLSRDL